MPHNYSTITIRTAIKERLDLLRGRKSWDDFMQEVAEGYPVDDALIAEMEDRLAELRKRKVRGSSWADVKAKAVRRRG